MKQKAIYESSEDAKQMAAKIEDIVTQGILLYLSGSKQARLVDIEEVIPLFQRNKKELSKALDYLVNNDFLHVKDPGIIPNGHTIYRLSPKGDNLALYLSNQEAKNGYPTIKRIVARVIYDRFKIIREKYSIEEIEDILIHDGRALLAELEIVESENT